MLVQKNESTLIETPGRFQHIHPRQNPRHPGRNAGFLQRQHRHQSSDHHNNSWFSPRDQHTGSLLLRRTYYTTKLRTIREDPAFNAVAERQDSELLVFR